METFEDSYNLHKISVQEEAIKLKCLQCYYTCKLPRTLKLHIQSIHEGTEFPCHKCEFRAESHNCLRKHILVEHKGVIDCDQCDYKTKRWHILRDHVHDHEGVVKP